ncbi:MAG: SDR family oxidoreductase [Rhodospirillales bacterium]|nr:SDR family oxidoreductase [Rhodospirillales bacterium]
MLHGKTALITGSLDGIGFAVARALAGAGAAVMLHGLAPPEAGAARVAELRGAGARAAFHGADLRDPEQIAALVAATEAALGPPDILVNNAVVRAFAPIEEFSPAAWNEALAVNLSAPFHLIRLTLPAMRRAGWGRIVNLASIYGIFATVNRVDYITTKTALIGLTRGVALEVAKTAITCNALCPGTVLTPAIDARLAAEVARSGVSRAAAEAAFIGARQPSGRFVAAENVAGLAVFLCGPHGADINGAALPVDGAWSAGR